MLKQNRSLFPLALAAGLACFGGFSSQQAYAQGGAFMPPLDAMDELNQAPVGGGGAFGGAVDRARGAANQTQGGFGAEGAGGAFGPGGVGGGDFVDPYGGFGMPQQQQFTPYVPPPTVRAWGGERVVQFTPDPDRDINDYEREDILADAREIRVLATGQGAYPNVVRDGNEDVFTNIVIRRDYISPEAGVVRTRMIQTLRFMSSLNPREFTLVRVATTDPISPFPLMLDLEAEQDERLQQWFEDFMEPYLNLEDDGEDFTLVRSFVAPPPMAPNIPLPANFNPATEVQEGQEGQPGAGGMMMGTEAGMFGGDVTGDPMGAASSRYF
ncbi:MAG: hypothetical protein JJU11_16420 [Candidatus Sumerlaeia bacterium]|nr:hypothetical protein [Candidatus Sumerlaeia bacterium]